MKYVIYDKANELYYRRTNGWGTMQWGKDLQQATVFDKATAGLAVDAVNRSIAFKKPRPMKNSPVLLKIPIELKLI